MKWFIWSAVVAMHVSLWSQTGAGTQFLRGFTTTIYDIAAAAVTPLSDKSKAGIALAKSELPKGAALADEKLTPHVIDLKKWGILNNGTKPIETTKGINKALQWAKQNKIQSVTLPGGTYLIDKNSYINMVSNMVFDLPKDVIIQKETNAKEFYHTFYIGVGVENVVLRGGSYKGDKETHDYKKKDSPHSAGTHESGYGITIEGANAVTIDGVKATEFTGDGLMIGGHGKLIMDLYAASFVSGEINDKGKAVANKQKIRTKQPISLSHSLLQSQKKFEITNNIKLPGTFDLVFLDKTGKFVELVKDKKVRETIAIPDKAASVHLIFQKADSKDAYIELWSRTVSSDIVVKNSEFAYNRRQGITVGGADRVLIQNNELHHMKGTLPQSGIDVEGGYHYNGHFNSNIYIKDNDFHSNASYDLILYDGAGALVEGNRMRSKGVIGLAISEPFEGAVIQNNHFDGSRIMAYHNATFIGNRVDRALASFIGTNVTIDGMVLTDAVLSLSSKDAFGIKVSNVTITSKDKKLESGLALWGKKLRLDNITITGESALRTVTGGIEPGSIINNLKVRGFNSTYGVSLPPATYNNCEFTGAEGANHGSIGVSLAGKYVFDNCTFNLSKSAWTGISADHAKLDLTVKNSTFNLLGNTQAISVQSAKNVLIENNTITGNALTSDKVELIKLNDYWKRNEKHDILAAAIRGNEIITNIPAIGISTTYAGTGAPSYTVENNKLTNALLALKDNDAVSQNESVSTSTNAANGAEQSEAK
ncbi:right-handed parallel beta-helix repeat-containing protein [Paenibacillus paeoniae]|nr:right-handed parallel beta-helix repeat-containing protein [Paenibacillus paeoniae]